jgi:hypothetical protein
VIIFLVHVQHIPGSDEAYYPMPLPEFNEVYSRLQVMLGRSRRRWKDIIKVISKN